MTTFTQSSKKRSLTPPFSDIPCSPTTTTNTETRDTKRPRRQSNSNDLLTELTHVLSEIKSTPSSGEISAELLETFKLLMLQIERLSSDETNQEAIQMKHESEKCLEGWFDDLLARCEADGELDLETLEEQLAAAGDDEDEDDMDAALSLALALDEEEAEEEEDEQVAAALVAAATAAAAEKEEEKEQEKQQDEGSDKVSSPTIQQMLV